jgi:hypothetical protein
MVASYDGIIFNGINLTNYRFEKVVRIQCSKPQNEKTCYLLVSVGQVEVKIPLKISLVDHYIVAELTVTNVTEMSP